MKIGKMMIYDGLEYRGVDRLVVVYCDVSKSDHGFHAIAEITRNQALVLK